MKKTILSIALIALAPITARADYTYTYTNTPAGVTGNGNAIRARNPAPYQIATINDDDDEHIASTAYVKGAYNDTIAAINEMNATKQQQLSLSETGGPTSDYVVQSPQIMEPIEDPQFGDTVLMTATAVSETIDYKLDNKRVEIYTTWDDDDEVAEVPLITASGQ